MTFRDIALLVGIGVGMLLVSGGITLLVLVRIPADTFKTERRAPAASRRHPALRITLRILKNLAGLAVVAVGVLMSVPGVPGQGILTILLGLMLLEFPGKYRLERRIVGTPRVRGFIDRLRARFGRPPLDLS
jgi:hypothetical protein